MNIVTKVIILFATLLSLGACESSHISLIRIDTINLEEAIKLTDENVTSLVEIKSIVDEVCNQYGLKNNSENTDSEIKYTRYWGSSSYQHPNSIYLSLNPSNSDKHILEISIFEWETIKQTEFGNIIQNQLLKQLKTLVPEQEITVEGL